MKTKRKVKVRIPKIKVDKNGRRYIMLGKKKVYLSKGMSERDLIKFIIERLKPKRRARKATTSRRTGIDYPVGLNTSSATNVLDKLQAQKEDLKQVKQEIQQELKQLEYKPEKQDDKKPQLLLKQYTDEDGNVYQVTEKQMKEYMKYIKDKEKEIKDQENELKNRNKLIKDLNIESKKKYADDIGKLVREELDSYKSAHLREMAKEAGISVNNANKGQKGRDQLLKELKDAGIIDVDMIFDEMKAKHPYEGLVLNDIANLDDLNDSDDSIATAIYIPSESTSSPQLQGTGKVDDDGMDTNQINKIMRKYKDYKGCIGSDQISSVILPQVKPHSRVCWVQNTDPSTKAGVHWVAVLIDARPNGSMSVEYYNPLGSGSRDKVPKAFIKNVQPILQALQTNTYMKFKENMIPDQNATSSNCGEFAMHFLIDRLRGKTFSQASGWDKLGEKRIEEWKKKLPAFRYIDGFNQHGEGIKEIYQSVKNAVVKGAKAIGKIFSVQPRKQFSPSIRKLLELYGNNKIVGIKVYREPIKTVLNKILNWVTLGTFQQNLKDLNYDTAFHLFMYITLDNGVTIRWDKNHVVEAKVQSVPHHEKAEERIVPNVKPIGLNDFLNKAIDSVGVNHYFLYDSRNHNCQDFILVNLRANGLLTNELKEFIFQDPEKIYKGLGLLGSANKVITDIASKGDVLLNGGKRKIVNRRRKIS